MKTLLQLMNKNLGTDFKKVSEYGASADKIDMKIVAKTLYQYMLYQETIQNIDPDEIKIVLDIKNNGDKKNN